MKMRDAYGKALVQLGKENKDIVVLSADVYKSCGCQLFQQQFPQRFFTVGVAEQNMVGIAAGLAAYGKIPFVNTFACFFLKAIDQIRISVAYPALNVKIVGAYGGISTGPDGATHQTIEDVAIMRSIPNMTVIAPADANEAAQATKACVEHKGPVYMRFVRPNVEPIFDENYCFQVGKASVLRQGNDATIIAAGITVSFALTAADALMKEGLKVRVLNCSSIKPLDKEAVVQAALETGAIVTVEDHNILGGLGSAVAEIIKGECHVLLEIVGVQDQFGRSGKPEELYKIYRISAQDIAQSVRELINKKRSLQLKFRNIFRKVQDTRKFEHGRAKTF